MRLFYSLFLLLSVLILSCSKPEDPNAQLNKEVRAIDDYLEETETDYIAYANSGIRLVIHEFGEMPMPTPGQSVRASISASLFGSTTPFTTVNFKSKLDSIGEDGLNYAVSSIPGGSVATIYVPSEYAYGETGTTNVPPNTTIVYEVDLQEVFRTATQQTQFESDTATIRDYLATNGIQNVIEHPSGIFYTLETLGVGTKPRVYDNTTFTYSGSLLTSATTFDAGTLTNYNLFNLIQGLRIGIPQLNKGSSATFYIPSGLGYGSTGSGSTIPANANLKFKIDLKAQ